MQHNPALSWQIIPQVVTFIVSSRTGRESEVLLGLKRNGIIAGCVVPPGGHVENDDLSIWNAASREAVQETGLRITGGIKMAESRIRIEALKRKIIVHSFLCSSYTGQLHFDRKEFEWMRFIPLSKIPWDRLPPGDEPWIRDVLASRRRQLVTMLCGADRMDLKSTRIRPLP